MRRQSMSWKPWVLPVLQLPDSQNFHPHRFSLDRCSSEVIRISVGANGLAKFEDCLQRLEKIVQELEKGEVPLEKSLTLFEEGMQLSATCRKQLEEAEGKGEITLQKNGKLQTEPFEPPAEKALRK